MGITGITGHRKSDGKVHALADWRPEPPRDAVIRIRLTADEKTEWKRAAVMEGRTLSEMLRHIGNVYARECIAAGGVMRFVKVTFGDG